MMLRHYFVFLRTKRLLVLPIHHHHQQQQVFFFSTKNNNNNNNNSNNNTTIRSLRLYRILQRQCQDLFHKNNNNNNTGTEQNEWLFQPPLNARDYGLARSFFASTSSTTKNNIITNQRNNLYRFFRSWNKNDENDESDDDEDDDASQQNKDLILSQWYKTVTQQQDETNSNHYGDDEDDHDYHSSRPFSSIPSSHSNSSGSSSSSLWASENDLKDAIRHAFRANNATTITVDPHQIRPLHGLAIQAVRLLNEQESIMTRTSISIDTQRGVRVVATSQCIGGSTSFTRPSSSSIMPTETKHRFAYRIRVENLPSSTDTVQLLGRTWHIHEEYPNGEYPQDEEPITVDAPNTGAVGHLPVLQPGQVFEYMSGCELATARGSMDGCFHMAIVDKDTRSAKVGDAVDTFENNLGLFQLPVKPFPLRVR